MTMSHGVLDVTDQPERAETLTRHAPITPLPADDFGAQFTDTIGRFLQFCFSFVLLHFADGWISVMTGERQVE